MGLSALIIGLYVFAYQHRGRFSLGNLYWDAHMPVYYTDMPKDNAERCPQLILANSRFFFKGLHTILGIIGKTKVYLWSMAGIFKVKYQNTLFSCYVFNCYFVLQTHKYIFIGNTYLYSALSSLSIVCSCFLLSHTWQKSVSEILWSG